VRAPGIKRRRRVAPPAISARLNGHVALKSLPGGKITVCFHDYVIDLGAISGAAAERALHLRDGLPLASFASSRRAVDKELDRLVRRLARQGLLEYRLARSKDSADQVVIEPQVADYWPRTAALGDADVLALSRFAYMRRRGNDLVLESPRASALFRICNPDIVAALAALSAPQPIKRLRRRGDFPGLELLGLLVDCQIVFKIDRHGESGLRPDEGDDSLVLWDFHDLVFHARSTQGRHANPLGGVFPYAGVIAPLPAVRQRWPGKSIDLNKQPAAQPDSPVAKSLRERHSTRSFDDRRPITLAELSQFLDGTARVLSRRDDNADPGGVGPVIEYTTRPYPSAGSAYELELYLAVDRCEGLARGFYHYDAGAHALVPIDAPENELKAMLAGATMATGVTSAPQILITIAARFGRVTWKYSSIAYSLILKDVGVLLQSFYLMAADLGLGGCAIGIADIDQFAKMTGLEFHVEGPVGRFAMGRGIESGASG
jgi:SagB-type dehydrogenase family enzyme